MRSTGGVAMGKEVEFWQEHAAKTLNKMVALAALTQAGASALLSCVPLFSPLSPLAPGLGFELDPIAAANRSEP